MTHPPSSVGKTRVRTITIAGLEPAYPPSEARSGAAGVRLLQTINGSLFK